MLKKMMNSKLLELVPTLTKTRQTVLMEISS